MRVLIISCVFPPEPVVSSQTSNEIARALTERGHDVTVLTTYPSRPAGKLYTGYRRSLFSISIDPAGFKVVRCFTVLSTQSRMVSRFLENLSFGLTSGLAALVAPRPQVIYSNSWPIFATGLLSLVARLRQVPTVISVQDLYPEALIYQGRISQESLLTRWLLRVDRMIARSSKEVVVISQNFAEQYRNKRGVRSTRLHYIPNWGGSQDVFLDERPIYALRPHFRLPQDAFIAVYGGNIGLAAGVETIIRAFGCLEHEQRLRLLIAGEGGSLDDCRDLIDKSGCENIHLHSPWLLSETADILGLANIFILPTLGRQSLASMPSKLIRYMLASRPVIALALPGSDLAKTMDASGCGWVVPPDDPEQLARKIMEIQALDTSELILRGRSGREYAQNNLVQKVCLPKIVGIIEQAAIPGTPYDDNTDCVQCSANDVQ